jgi:N-acyl-D-amino-acid deacylase
MKHLLKGGKVYDGTGSDAYIGDILFEDDRVLQVAPSIDEALADSVTDISGKSVSSGFIDCHSHNDWFAIKKAPLPYFDPFIRQGITTFVTGNCGLSSIGFEKDTPFLDKIGGGLFGYRGDTTGVYSTAGELLDAIDGNSPCNTAVLVGHCSARATVAGFSNRPLTESEEKRMLSILEDNLKSGAAGISLGLMYEPGIYAPLSEIKKVADLCVKYDRILAVHAKAESKVSMAYPSLFGRSHLLRALDELYEISKGTNLKLQYSHAIFVGRATLKDHPEFLEMVEKMRSEGIRIQFDIYNELKGVSVITVILPSWYQGLSEKDRKRPINRMKLSALINATTLLLGFGWNDIKVAYIGPGYEKYEGKTVAELAKEYGKSPLTIYLQLCQESNFQGRVNMGPYTTEEIIHDFEKNDNCYYMTDAWVEDHGVQNPAIYDCFPKFLQDSLRGLGDTMPKTIRKMTGATADRFMLRERGYIKEGYFADLTVFDEKELLQATPGCNRSFGIHSVYINGKLVLNGDTLHQDFLKISGRAIRI